MSSKKSNNKPLHKKNKNAKNTKKYTKSNISNLKVINSKISKFIGGSNNNDTLPRKLKHFWFTEWPDNGVPLPENIDSFKTFMTTIFNDIKDNGGTTVIHCSAGIGRSGVVYVILRILCILSTEGFDITNIPFLYEKRRELVTFIDSIIKQSRRERHKNFVQTKEQYEFIINYFNQSITFKSENLKQAFNNLEIPESNRCNENTLDSLKDRYTNILPCLTSRVKLKKEGEGNEKSTYINASIMKPLKIDNLFFNIFVSQGPTANTVDDFARMLFENNVTRVIQVTKLVENNVPKCDPYIYNEKNELNMDSMPTNTDTFETNLELTKVNEVNETDKYKLTISPLPSQLSSSDNIF